MPIVAFANKTTFKLKEGDGTLLLKYGQRFTTRTCYNLSLVPKFDRANKVQENDWVLIANALSRGMEEKRGAKDSNCVIQQETSIATMLLLH